MLEWATGQPKRGQRLSNAVARRYVYLPANVGGINLLRNDPGMNLQSLHLEDGKGRDYTQEVRPELYI